MISTRYNYLIVSFIAGFTSLVFLTSPLYAQYSAELPSSPSSIEESLENCDRLPVVFVHGINGQENLNQWNNMMESFIAAGWRQDELYLNPLSTEDCDIGLTNRCSNATDSSQIKMWVERAKADHGVDKVILVAHSMGGLSSRHYMKEANPVDDGPGGLDGHHSVDTYILIGSMQHGLFSPCTNPLPTPYQSELCESGDFIRDYAGDRTYPLVRMMSIYSATDGVVDVESSVVQGAERNVLTPSELNLDHVELLGSDFVSDQIEDFIGVDKCNVSGVDRVLVMRVGFTDTQLHSVFQNQEVQESFNLAEEYFDEVSSGKYNVEVSHVNGANRVILPRTMADSSGGYYTNGYASFGNVSTGAAISGGEIDEALCSAKVNGEDINLNNFDKIVLMYEDSIDRHVSQFRKGFNPTELQEYGEVNHFDELVLESCDSQGSFNTFYNKDIVTLYVDASVDRQAIAPPANEYSRFFLNIIHSFGHSLGFEHASADRSLSAYTGKSLGNPFDAMGTGQFSLHYGASYKALAGWLDNVEYIQESNRYHLFPVETENANGPQQAVVLSNSQVNFTLEFRQPVGVFDQSLGLFPNQAEGLLRVENSGSHGTILKAFGKNYDQLSLKPGECFDGGDFRIRIPEEPYAFVGSGENRRIIFDVDLASDPNFEDPSIQCAPDLIVEHININPLNSTQGDDVTFSFTIKNQGGLASDNTNLDFYIEKHGGLLGLMKERLSIMDRSADVDALEPGESVTTKSFVLNFSEEGNYVVIANLDLGEYGDENNSKTHKKEKPFTVNDDEDGGGPIGVTKEYSLGAQISSTNGGVGGFNFTIIDPQNYASTFSCESSCDLGKFEEGSMVVAQAWVDDSTDLISLNGPSCSAEQCRFILEDNSIVEAQFEFITQQVSVEKTGEGDGIVTVSYFRDGEGVEFGNCDIGCDVKDFTIPYGATVNVSVVADDQSKYCEYDDSRLEFVCGEPNNPVNTIVTISDDHLIRIRFEPVEMYQLTFEKLGTGKGLIVAKAWKDDELIKQKTCGHEQCQDGFTWTLPEGSRIEATASGGDSNAFIGWFFACTGTGTCNIDSLDRERTIKAKFEPKYTLSVTKSSKGIISTTQSSLINCGPSRTKCSAKYTKDTSVVLKASPISDYKFVKWQGSCTHTSKYCTVDMSGNKSVSAIYEEIDTRVAIRLTMTKDCVSFNTNLNCSDGLRAGDGVLKEVSRVDGKVNLYVPEGSIGGTGMIYLPDDGDLVAIPSDGDILMRVRCSGEGAYMCDCWEAGCAINYGIHKGGVENITLTYSFRKDDCGPFGCVKYELLLGDVNGDREITIHDAQKVFNYVNDNTYPGVEPVIADTDCDGEVTAADAQLILSAAGDSSLLPLTCPDSEPPQVSVSSFSSEVNSNE